MIPYMVVVATIWIGVPVAIFLFGRRLLRAMEQRSVSQSELATIADRLARVEARIEDIASDQEKLAEGQRFTQKVLAGRPHVEE
jgi:hypothetical protein